MRVRAWGLMALDDVGVHLDAAVVEEHSQPLPVPDRVADGFRQVGGGGHAARMVLQPDMQGVDDGPTSVVAHASAVFGGVAA